MEADFLLESLLLERASFGVLSSFPFLGVSWLESEIENESSSLENLVRTLLLNNLI